MRSPYLSRPFEIERLCNHVHRKSSPPQGSHPHYCNETWARLSSPFLFFILLSHHCVCFFLLPRACLDALSNVNEEAKQKSKNRQRNNVMQLKLNKLYSGSSSDIIITPCLLSTLLMIKNKTVTSTSAKKRETDILRASEPIFGRLKSLQKSRFLPFSSIPDASRPDKTPLR